MKHTLLLCAVWACSQVCIAQQSDKFPLGKYTELSDTKAHDSEAIWNRLPAPTQFSWGTTDSRYAKRNVPKINQTTRFHTKAWKGERINAQAVVWTNTDLEGATLSVGDLKNGASILPASAITPSFVGYVMTDELNKDGKGGCGHRENKAEWDSSMVADALDIVQVKEIKAYTAQPVWVNVWVPSDAQTGTYKGTLTLVGTNFKAMTLQLEVEVQKHTLPAPKEWAFHLDLWQNPYSVARYYQVPLWSQEHFDAMRPIMKRLANAGQKVITTTIMHKPWNGQTEDAFDSMVFRMKKLDGSWAYDYTIFDKWVEFMMNEIGIDQQINCYTLIPWALSFDYFDQATNRVLFVEAKPGDAAYEAYWGTFLKDFARHLRAKGWFQKTTIAMDERSSEAMQAALAVIRRADPEFKVSLAGNYHDEIQAQLYELCVAYGQRFPQQVREERRLAGKKSTVYTCCAEARPNLFTFSPAAESTWLGWHVAAGDYDGYLRWAYNSWTIDPLRDSRFRTWAAGDCYLVYPGNRSSIRMERFVEGVQDFEKIRILRQKLHAKGEKEKLKRLNQTVAAFAAESITESNAAEMVNKARSVLNAL